jgi:hypothetical protein
VALRVHPDRVDPAEKEEATEKFKVLAKLNEVLTGNFTGFCCWESKQFI